MKHITQEKVVLAELMKRKKGITSWDMITKYGITRLSAHIHRLRRRGYEIISTMEPSKDGYFARYILIKGVK